MIIRDHSGVFHISRKRYEKESGIQRRYSSMSYWVYMLQCRDGSLYTGSAADPNKRLAVHQSGKGAKYTRSRLPVQLVYLEEVADKSAALKREAAIKKLSRKEKLSLIPAAETDINF